MSVARLEDLGFRMSSNANYEARPFFRRDELAGRGKEKRHPERFHGGTGRDWLADSRAGQADFRRLNATQSA